MHQPIKQLQIAIPKIPISSRHHKSKLLKNYETTIRVNQGEVLRKKMLPIHTSKQHIPVE